MKHTTTVAGGLFWTALIGFRLPWRWVERRLPTGADADTSDDINYLSALMLGGGVMPSDHPSRNDR